MTIDRIRPVAERITKECEGPFYILDLVGIRAEVEHFLTVFKKRFPRVLPAYSFKTNGLRAITRLMCAMRLGAEVVSGPELAWALDDGFAVDTIFFDGPLKTANELDLAVQAGVRIQIDSIHELKSLIDRTPAYHPLHLSARLSTEYKDGQLSRFGFSIDEFRQARAWLRDQGRDFVGLHLHVGSNVPDPRTYVRALNHTSKVLAEMWSTIHWIDLGGGFPANSGFPGGRGTRLPLEFFADHLQQFFMSVGVSLHDKLLVLEPGRCLVEDHGYLLSRVEYRKDRPGRMQLVTNGGLHLIRSNTAWHHPADFLRAPTNGGTCHYEVYGANCFESDLYHDSLLGPSDVGPGDWVIVGSAGGYDIPSANVWTRPAPPIYGYDGSDRPLLLRAAQSPCDMRNNQKSDYADKPISD